VGDRIQEALGDRLRDAMQQRPVHGPAHYQTAARSRRSGTREPGERISAIPLNHEDGVGMASG
jgi:hypothetical protein